MDANTLNDLREKEATGSITEDEYVALLREEDGEDEQQARRMYQIVYAAQREPGYGETWVN